MSQEFVKNSLKAPSTAKFPTINKSSSKAIGNCQFQVASYVDAQNGFGAMLRTHYTATILRHPDKGSWSALAVNVGG